MHICAFCWKRPGLLGWELLWRWGFGIPAAAILYHQAALIAASVSLNQESLSNLSLSDPLGAGQQLTAAAAALTPPWCGRLSGWGHCWPWRGRSRPGWDAAQCCSVSTRHLRPAPLTLILLQLLRIAALVAVCVGWYRAIGWAADATLSSAAPNLVAWSAWVICLTLGIFVLWALLSWIFSIAPLLAMLEGTGVFRSLARSLRLGPLTAKLVEVNLVLGIVRLALIVLALVFSAIPLPFEADMTGTALYAWWAVVTLLYLVASDFFQVARLAAFVQFWRLYHRRR